MIPGQISRKRTESSSKNLFLASSISIVFELPVKLKKHLSQLYCASITRHDDKLTLCKYGSP